MDEAGFALANRKISGKIIVGRELDGEPWVKGQNLAKYRLPQEAQDFKLARKVSQDTHRHTGHPGQ
jgi:hypothetical protein